MNYNDYIIDEIDHKAYDLYRCVDEDEQYRGVHHTFFDFISDKNEYLYYYSKAKIELRKDKLTKISEINE